MGVSILSPLKIFGCAKGSIRPPGVDECLVIDDILAGRVKISAPSIKCPVDWQRQSKNGFCLPAFNLIACGSDDFACDRERGDTFRIVRGPSKCSGGSGGTGGTMTVLAVAPRFEQNGEVYLGMTTALACGPVGKNDPIQ